MFNFKKKGTVVVVVITNIIIIKQLAHIEQLIQSQYFFFSVAPLLYHDIFVQPSSFAAPQRFLSIRVCVCDTSEHVATPDRSQRRDEELRMT